MVSDMTDIVKQLRDDKSPCRDWKSTMRNKLHDDAADEIEQLREKIRKLEERNSELSWTLYPDRMGR